MLRRYKRRGVLAALAAVAGAVAAPGRRESRPIRADAGSSARSRPAALTRASGRYLQVGGSLPFLVGANYEGPADRPWKMWADGRFDLTLIEADFSRAASIGLRCVRLFVQGPLTRDIKRRQWDRLDAAVNLAERYGLLLLLTFGDYDETLLAILGRDIGLVVAHYAGHPTVLGYDLRNEPKFRDLLIARYPGWPSAPPLPLQEASLLIAYGEGFTAEAVVQRRRVDPNWLPTRLTDEQAYWYANSLAIYDSLHAQASDWTAARPGTTFLDYLALSDSERWGPLLRLTNDALAQWLAALIEPIRQADPTRALTVGYDDLLLASRPANAGLDFVSFHHYLPADDSAPVYAAEVLATLGARLGKPALLGEFGWSTGEHSPERVAELEAATFRELQRRGLAGGLKWVLNDIADTENAHERGFGIFTADGSPKPSAEALRAVAAGR
jgi:hypothetical protein